LAESLAAFIARFVAGISIIILALVIASRLSEIDTFSVASGFFVIGLIAKNTGIRKININKIIVVFREMDCPIKYSTPIRISRIGQNFHKLVQIDQGRIPKLFKRNINPRIIKTNGAILNFLIMLLKDIHSLSGCQQNKVFWFASQKDILLR